MIEHKSFDVRWKGLDSPWGSVELYAAVFGNVDRSGEVIQPGAFKNLGSFTREGWLGVHHDWKRLPIATVDSAVEDGFGLRIGATFHSTPDAQAMRTTIRERIFRGKSVSASIGYKVLKDEHIKVNGKSVRSLKALELYEASIVQVGANAEAGVIAAKSRAYGRVDGSGLYLRYLAICGRHCLHPDPPDPATKLHSKFLSICAEQGLPLLSSGPRTPGPDVAARLHREFLAICARNAAGGRRRVR